MAEELQGPDKRYFALGPRSEAPIYVVYDQVEGISIPGIHKTFDDANDEAAALNRAHA
jgi:hypothetical protein